MWWWRDGNCTPPILNSSNNRVKAKSPTRVCGGGGWLRRGQERCWKAWKQEKGVEGKIGQEEHLELSADVHKCGTAEFKFECAQEGCASFSPFFPCTLYHLSISEHCFRRWLFFEYTWLYSLLELLCRTYIMWKRKLVYDN